MDLLVIVPPIVKPCEANLGALIAAQTLRAAGVDSCVIDASLGWFHYTLSVGRLRQRFDRSRQLTRKQRCRFSQSLDRLERDGPLFAAAQRFANAGRYVEDVYCLRDLLLLEGLDFPGQTATPGDFTLHNRRPTCPAHLLEFARSPSTIFDEYIRERLVPEIRARNASVIGLSLTYLNQVFAAVRIASLIKESLPNVPLVLGGALLEAWPSSLAALAPFDLFSGVFAWSCAGQEQLRRFFHIHKPLPRLPLVPASHDLDSLRYFSPRPVVPLAAGNGCYYHQCSFCPDYGRGWQAPVPPAEFTRTIARTVNAYPAVHLHLTDSSVPISYARELARWISGSKSDVTWHGFFRLEPALAEEATIAELAGGGCLMMEFGVETASPRLLQALNKGITPSRATTILRHCAAHGIRTYVYLLFGLPGETEDDREATLAFVAQHEESITFLNNSVFNLALSSPMALAPDQFGITEIHNREDALSLYADFSTASVFPRVAARQFLNQRFLRQPSVARILRRTPPFFKANHAPFVGLASDDDK